MGESTAAGRGAYIKKHLIALFLSELDQVSEFATDRSHVYGVCCPSARSVAHIALTKPLFLFFHQHRQLLKDSFMVELVEGARKLRHVFLFTDLFLCAKLKKQIGG